MLDYLKLLLECIPDGDFSPVRPLLADTFGTMTEPGEFINLSVDRSPPGPRIKAWNDFRFFGGYKAWEEPEKKKDELIAVLTELLAPFRDERMRSLLQLVRLVGDRGVCETPKRVLLSEFGSYGQGIFYPEAKYALLRRRGPEETPGFGDSWILDLTLDKNDRIILLKLTNPRYVVHTDLKNDDKNIFLM